MKRKIQETRYENDKKSGKKIHWYENGKISSITHYNCNEENGEIKYYHEDGTLYYWTYHFKPKRIMPFKPKRIMPIDEIIYKWKMLTKFINLKKERRMIKRLLEVKNTLCLFDTVTYMTIMSYLDWYDRLDIIKNFVFSTTCKN